MATVSFTNNGRRKRSFFSPVHPISAFTICCGTLAYLVPLLREPPHSTRFSGKGYHCSSKASRGEDLQVEEPVWCGDSPAFHFHATLTRMLGSTLIRDEV